MSDLVAWCFHSPRRLLGVGLAVLALLIGGGVAVRALTPSGAGPEQTAGSTAVAVVPGSAGAADAALAFVRAWAGKPAQESAAQRRQSLASLVTPDLARTLEQTDPAQLPGGVPRGAAVPQFVAASSAMFAVTLSTGRTVLVTLVTSGGRWLASDVQPFTGDLGDVATPASGSG